MCGCLQYGVKDGPTLTSKGAYLVKSALDDLSEFMSTPHERENKNRQKLLRNLRVSGYEKWRGMSVQHIFLSLVAGVGADHQGT